MIVTIQYFSASATRPAIHASALAVPGEDVAGNLKKSFAKKYYTPPASPRVMNTSLNVETSPVKVKKTRESKAKKARFEALSPSANPLVKEALDDLLSIESDDNISAQYARYGGAPFR